MYAQLIETLSTNDRKALAAAGVPSSRVSEWRSGFRLPTRPQVLALARVKGVDYIELEKELMAIETEKEAATKPEMRNLISEVMGLQRINYVSEKEPNGRAPQNDGSCRGGKQRRRPKHRPIRVAGTHQNATCQRR